MGEQQGLAGPTLSRVLVSNRGEIAIRIAKAASALGMDSVGVYAPVDGLSLHARVALRYREGRTFTIAFREMRGDFTEFILCTRDLHGLYGMVAGTLAACGLNILGSHVYTTRSGLALEVYRLSTPSGGPKELELAWKELERRLDAVLTGKVTVESLLQARRRPAGAHGPLAQPPPVVAVSSDESEFYTIADVSANDRIGLLYDLASTIGDLDLEVYISKAATIRDQVTDTFYLKDRKGAQIREPAKLDEIRSRLYQAALGRSPERPSVAFDEEPRGPRDPGSEAPEPAADDDLGIAPNG